MKFTENGIEIKGMEKPLYCGAVHYWRIDRENWSRVLDEICGMGFEIIETYIPWSVHEYQEGRYDFGELDDRKDLDGFLYLCEEKGLSVIVRPGPHINAELTLFGYPEWILHDERIQAKNPWGTTVVYPYVTKQFPIPSYASEVLYEKTEEYFRRLVPVLHKHIGEKGCIIAVQADNETCNFFRDRPYIMDYSDASLRLYRHFLKERYQTVGKLNESYCSDYPDFESVAAPHGFQGEKKEELPYYFDWVEYKEYQILYALKRMIAILNKLDLKLPIFHNCAYQNYTPISVARDEELEGLSVAGIDAYQEPKDKAMLQERIRYLAGSSRLPFVPEFGSGSWFDRNCLLTPEEEEYGYLYSFMNGLKAISFYMLVERDRWTGCPVTADGRVRENFYRMFREMLRMLKEEKIHQYRRRPKILILKNYDMGRLKALYSILDLNQLSSNCFITGPDIPAGLFTPDTDLGLHMDRDDSHYAKEAWVDQVAEVLNGQHYEFNYSDRYLQEERYRDYDVIFVSCYDFMDREMQERLVRFSRCEGKRVFLGPYVPYLDRDFRECTVVKEALEETSDREKQKGKADYGITLLPDPGLLDFEHLKPQKEYICEEKYTGGEDTCEDEYPSEEAEVEIAVHYHPSGRDHLLFVANHSSREKTIRLHYRENRSLRSVWRGKGSNNNNMLTAQVPPHAVSIWKAEMEEQADDKQ